MSKKLSELPPTSTLDRDDLFLISQSNVSKRISKQDVFMAMATATIIIASESSGVMADKYTDGLADNVEFQEALTELEDRGGGSVFICAGDYAVAAQVSVPSNVTIFGEGDRTVIRASSGLADTVNIFANADPTTGNINITVKDITIDGNQTNRTGTPTEHFGSNLYFEKVSDSKVLGIKSINAFASGIEIGPGSHDNIIANNHFLDSHWHGLLLAGKTDPVYVYNNTIANNVVRGSGTDSDFEGVGIEVAKYCVRNTFTGNTSSDNAESGMNLFYRCTNNTVVGNSFYNNTGGGVILVDESDYNTVSGNTIVGSGTTGISATNAFLSRGGFYNIVANNMIADCDFNGIRGQLTGWSIENNTIRDCGAGGTSTQMHGLYSFTPTDIKIDNNRIIGSAARGMEIVDATNPTVTGNRVVDSVDQGIFFDYSTIGVVDGVISNNICIGNGNIGLILFKGGLRCTISGNVCRDNINAGLDIRGAADCTIVGNSCTGNSTYGLDIKNDAAGTGTTGCTISSNRVTGNTLGGIRETGAADNNIYLGNNCLGNTAANFATVGANNEYGHNKTA